LVPPADSRFRPEVTALDLRQQSKAVPLLHADEFSEISRFCGLAGLKVL
jgi:hypothetical protein